MDKHKLKTEWIRAAVSGETVDGRVITEQQLIDIADTYDLEVYAAHIWLEHIRGILPADLFKSLGDVVQVKTERITDGVLMDKLGLYVILEPSPDLIAMVRNGQKVHLSVEIEPDFAGTGKAYLMGLGVTDSPASIGTGLMKFSTTTRTTSIFSEPLVCEFGNCEPPVSSELARITTMLEKLTSANTYATKTEVEKLTDEVAALRKEIEAFGNQTIQTDLPAPEFNGGGIDPDFYHRNRNIIGY